MYGHFTLAESPVEHRTKEEEAGGSGFPGCNFQSSGRDEIFFLIVYRIASMVDLNTLPSLDKR